VKLCLLLLKEELIFKTFENRELRRIFGSEKDEVTDKWRQLCYEIHYSLFYSLNIVRVLLGNLRQRDHLVDLGVHGRITLK